MPCFLHVHAVLCFVAALGAASQTTGCQPERARAEAERVTLHHAERVAMPAGGSSDAAIQVAVAAGYHVQASRVPFDYLIPTRLDVTVAEGVAIGSPAYPPGKPYPLEGSSDTLSVYDGVFAITLPVRASPETLPGRYVLRGTLHYQLCDRRTCLRPASQPVVIAVDVREPGATEIDGQEHVSGSRPPAG
jgi:DsbC/DsbD-like thiol-disulfide interchange protein